ncbi:MAG TPA: hypothetical protein VER17_00800, partial [Tepidisphaeraceae bacterium]|nr:hypothetical protein [Tepidisphaeraceae bacterium]
MRSSSSARRATKAVTKAAAGSAATVAKIALALACGATVIGASAGCDDARAADKRVQAAVDQARIARLKEGPERAQELLAKAAGDAAEASASTRAHAKSVLAHAQQDAAARLISDPVKGINPGNREIARLMWEIDQLGQQIRTSNNLVASYRQFDPKPALAAAAQQIEAVSGGAPGGAAGGAAGGAWIGEGPGAIPTLATAQQQVQQLEQQIEQQQQQIQQLRQQQQQFIQQSEQLARQSQAAARGPQATQIFAQASRLRKQAADALNQAEAQEFKLAQLQQDLAIARGRQQALGGAVEQFRKLAANIEQGWRNIEQQILAQTKLATNVLQGSAEDQSRASIAARAAALEAQTRQTQEAYTQAEQNLTDAVKHFEEAASAATQLGTDLRTATANLPGDNQMKKALDTMIGVYNPNVFKLGQANATLALAELQTSRAQTLAERQQLVRRLGETLQGAGLSLPPGLDGGGNPADVVKQADENFNAATELYASIAEGGGSESNKSAGRAGRIFALYGRTLLHRAAGQPQQANQFLTEARAQRDVILTEA